MDELSQLLHAVSNVIVEERALQEEKRKRGDNFNVFSVLGLQTSEVRLHSALIAELLNPNGDHGLGDKFLEAFLDVLNMHFNDKFIFDTKTAKVEVEHFIGSISDDGETGGRIDLFIQDQYKQTIIIENKIYACDQDRQMYRYNHYAKQNLNLKDEQVRLLYLTLEGDVPSKESCGDEIFDFTCISYKDDILKWLDKCLMVSALYPIVRETIRQYITTLKNILSIMENENSKKLIETLLSSRNNLDAALKIIDFQFDIQKSIIEEFIEKLRDLAKSEGMEFDADKDFSLQKKDTTIRFWLKDFSKARFTLQQEASAVYLGICTTENPQEIKMTKIYKKDPSAIWPYGTNELGYLNSRETLLDLKYGDKIYNYVKEELEKSKNYLEELHNKLIN